MEDGWSGCAVAVNPISALFFGDANPETPFTLMPSGTYLVSARGGTEVQTRKVVLVR